MRMFYHFFSLKNRTKRLEINFLMIIVFRFRAAAQSKLNNHSEAISDCVEALKIDPNYSKAYGRKGYVNYVKRHGHF